MSDDLTAAWALLLLRARDFGVATIDPDTGAVQPLSVEDMSTLFAGSHDTEAVRLWLDVKELVSNHAAELAQMWEAGRAVRRRLGETS